VKPTLTAALASVPPERLDWAPAEKMITLGQLFLHIAECSDWWYGEVMKKKMATELAVGLCPPKTEIARHMAAHWRRLGRMFKEPPAALARKYQIKSGNKTYSYSGYWIFTHLLEHDIHHRSQINQYLRILGITPPEI
jgi:uncharacterized damage-inducible protein DinB